MEKPLSPEIENTAVMHSICRQVVTDATDSLIVVDSDLAVILWNPAAAAFFGIAEADALGVALSRLLFPDQPRVQKHHDQMMRSVVEAPAGPAKMTGDRLITFKVGGEDKHLDIRLFSFFAEGRKFVASRIIDRTESVRYKEELHSIKDRLQVALKAAEDKAVIMETMASHVRVLHKVMVFAFAAMVLMLAATWIAPSSESLVSNIREVMLVIGTGILSWITGKNSK